MGMIDKHRILIIDDDANLRKTLSDILRAKGYEALSVKDGTEGLSVPKKVSVNLVLIDLQLPDISGLEVLERIKADHPSIEAIILTGHATLDSAIEATNRGAFSYLQKPYEIDQLMLHIRRAIEKQATEEKVIRHSIKLEKINLELKSLYEVSQAISRSIDMDKLFTEILHTLTGMDIFKVEHKGGIFIVYGGMMKLVSHLGHSDAFLNLHKDMKVGDCLCGLAAKTGKIVISRNSFEDDRHSIRYPEMSSHGHIIVPLKAKNIIVGVMYLYLPADKDIDEDRVKLLLSIGNQIGIAIENSMLYEETKLLSLRDPLTGLANRRLMHIIFEKNLAEARRFKKPFSVIMLDIDDFKIYNDTKGHAAGDKLLSELATLISNEIRKVDLAVRYGGEEFLLLLHETDAKGALMVAEKIRTAVAAKLEVTISLGVSTYQFGSEEKDEIINKADRALYQAKQKGKNRVEVSD